jgi:DNA ligase (NAD+)
MMMKTNETANSQVEQKFAGKNFVMTGTLETMARGEAAAEIEKRGGTVSSIVTRTTDYLVVGTDSGSRLHRAQELGVRVLTETEFLSAL